MNGNERMNESSSVPSSRRSRAATVTSIRAFARIELRIVAPLRDPTTDSNTVATPSPPRHRRRNRIFLSHHHPLLASIGVVSHPSSLLSPLSSLVARSNARVARRAAASPSLASSTVPSLLAHPSPRLGLGHVRSGPRNTSRTTASTSASLAPTRSSPARHLARPRARHARANDRANARIRASIRTNAIRSIDRTNERTIDRTNERAGRWRPLDPLGVDAFMHACVRSNPNPIAGLDDAETTKAAPRRRTWVCEVETRSRARTGW